MDRSSSPTPNPIPFKKVRLTVHSPQPTEIDLPNVSNNRASVSQPTSYPQQSGSSSPDLEYDVDLPDMQATIDTTAVRDMISFELDQGLEAMEARIIVAFSLNLH